MKIKLAAGLAFVLAIVGAWYFLQSTEITVWLYTDYAFRFNHQDWPTLVQRRFREANQIYQRSGANVRWKLVNSDRIDPVGNVRGIDNRRANLMLHFKEEATVAVVLTGVQEGERTGSTTPFTRASFVIDYPEESEAFNAKILATQLSLLFGAPRAAAELKTIKSQNSNKLTPDSAAIVNAMCGYPFQGGIDGLLQSSWRDKAVAAIAAHDLAPNTNPVAHAHTIVGTTLLNERKFEPALPHFELAAKLDPNNKTSHLNLAEAYTRNAQDEKAVPEVREVVRLAPDEPFAHRAMGAILGRTGRYEEAIKEIEIAIRMDPKDNASRVLLAMQLGKIPGRLDDAVSILQKAIEVDPGDVTAQEALKQAQQLKTAMADRIATLREVLKRDPNNPDVHYDLGKAEARLGDLNGAIRDLQKSATLRVNNGPAHLQLAELYIAKGEPEQAWGEVRKARAQGEDVPLSLIARLPPEK